MEVILGRFSARAILAACTSALIVMIVGGGALLGVVEGTGAGSGIWLAFNTVTTTGYGDGPVTLGGTLLSMALFVLGAACWFFLLIVGVEMGTTRSQKRSLIDEAMRPLSRRTRLFHVN